MPHPLDDLTRFPEEPGVYLFKDEQGRVLYVGKAGSLRSRLASYRKEPDPRKAVMVAKAADVDVVLAASEKEALVLESSLIKRHRPRYNVRLTDDKRYPYLLLTADPWPRVTITRDTRRAGKYFGPFPDAGAARRTLQVIREVFKIRDCKELIPGGCLNYQMDLCWAPCILNRDERLRKAPREALALADVDAEYGKAVKEASAFLGGNAGTLTREITREMESSAERMEFERAAVLRDRLQAITATLERQAVFAHNQEDRDAFVAVREGALAIGLVVLVRGGSVVEQEHFFFRRAVAETPGELLTEFIPRYYDHLPAIPREILVPELPDGHEALEAMLGERRGGPVRFVQPKKGDWKRVLEFADRNARFKVGQELLKRGEQDAGREAEDLQRHLNLPAPARVIECFDVSHLSGTGVVASMSVLEDGRPARSRYRRFKVKVDENDDYAAMEEVVGRRYARAVKEEETLPDLVLIDGGRGQLKAAKRALDDLGLTDLPVAALAKREEEVFQPKRLHPVSFDKSSPGLLALMRARDEAHRFAVRYQRGVRRRALTESGLDDLPGVGESKKRALLAHFGSPEKVAQAREEDLRRVPGIGRELAKRIREHYVMRA